jgi:hypothetical protein
VTTGEDTTEKSYSDNERLYMDRQIAKECKPQRERIMG